MFAGFVVRRGQAVFGYLDRCPHAGWPLASTPNRYLTRDGGRIFCSGHGAQFRIEDGLSLWGPCAGQGLAPWPVIVDAEGIVRTV